MAHRVALRVSRLVGVIWLLSAALKGVSPHAAARPLLDLGASTSASLAVIDAVGVAEALVGAGLMFGMVRAAPWALSLSSVLLLVHMWISVGAVDRSCGCFGAVPVPEALAVTSLILGGVASGVVMATRSPNPSPRSVAVLLGVRVLALMAIVPAGVRRVQTEDPLDVVLASAAIESSDRGVILVVSARCEHCRSALDQIESEDLRSQEDPDRRIAVLRESDPHFDEFVRTRDLWDPVVVSDSVWWRLIEGQPPTYVHLREGGAVVSTGAG